jgi:hypothetical protein
MLQAMLQNQSNPQQAVQQPTSGFNNNNNGAAGTANATPSAFGTNSQNTQNPTQMGQMGSQMGGGIAGVASKTTGHSIKVFNDQTDHSLWEFVYDMQQEAMANAPGMGPTNSTTSNGGINATQGNQSNSSGANSIAPSSSFGSGFGISPTQPPTTPPAPPPNQ